ncbi:centromere-associated protein E-like isoform X2 [Hoplias malabaricus]
MFVNSQLHSDVISENTPHPLPNSLQPPNLNAGAFWEFPGPPILPVHTMSAKPLNYLKAQQPPVLLDSKYPQYTQQFHPPCLPPLYVNSTQSNNPSTSCYVQSHIEPSYLPVSDLKFQPAGQPEPQINFKNMSPVFRMSPQSHLLFLCKDPQFLPPHIQKISPHLSHSNAQGPSCHSRFKQPSVIHSPCEGTSLSQKLYKSYRLWQLYCREAKSFYSSSPDVEALACFFLPVIRAITLQCPEISLPEAVKTAVSEWEKHSNYDRMDYYHMAQKFMEFEVEELKHFWAEEKAIYSQETPRQNQNPILKNESSRLTGNRPKQSLNQDAGRRTKNPKSGPTASCCGRQVKSNIQDLFEKALEEYSEIMEALEANKKGSSEDTEDEDVNDDIENEVGAEIDMAFLSSLLSADSTTTDVPTRLDEGVPSGVPLLQTACLLSPQTTDESIYAAPHLSPSPGPSPHLHAAPQLSRPQHSKPLQPHQSNSTRSLSVDNTNGPVTETLSHSMEQLKTIVVDSGSLGHVQFKLTNLDIHKVTLARYKKCTFKSSNSTKTKTSLENRMKTVNIEKENKHMTLKQTVIEGLSNVDKDSDGKDMPLFLDKNDDLPKVENKDVKEACSTGELLLEDHSNLSVDCETGHLQEVAMLSTSSSSRQDHSTSTRPPRILSPPSHISTPERETPKEKSMSFHVETNKTKKDEGHLTSSSCCPPSLSHLSFCVLRNYSPSIAELIKKVTEVSKLVRSSLHYPCPFESFYPPSDHSSQDPTQKDGLQELTCFTEVSESTHTERMVPDAPSNCSISDHKPVFSTNTEKQDPKRTTAGIIKSSHVLDRDIKSSQDKTKPVKETSETPEALPETMEDQNLQAEQHIPHQKYAVTDHKTHVNEQQTFHLGDAYLGSLKCYSAVDIDRTKLTESSQDKTKPVKHTAKRTEVIPQIVVDQNLQDLPQMDEQSNPIVKDSTTNINPTRFSSVDQDLPSERESSPTTVLNAQDHMVSLALSKFTKYDAVTNIHSGELRDAAARSRTAQKTQYLENTSTVPECLDFNTTELSSTKADSTLDIVDLKLATNLQDSLRLVEVETPLEPVAGGAEMSSSHKDIECNSAVEDAASKESTEIDAEVTEDTNGQIGHESSLTVEHNNTQVVSKKWKETGIKRRKSNIRPVYLPGENNVQTAKVTEMTTEMPLPNTTVENGSTSAGEKSTAGDVLCMSEEELNLVQKTGAVQHKQDKSNTIQTKILATKYEEKNVTIKDTLQSSSKENLNSNKCDGSKRPNKRVTRSNTRSQASKESTAAAHRDLEIMAKAPIRNVEADSSPLSESKNISIKNKKMVDSAKEKELTKFDGTQSTVSEVSVDIMKAQRRERTATGTRQGQREAETKVAQKVRDERNEDVKSTGRCRLKYLFDEKQESGINAEKGHIPSRLERLSKQRTAENYKAYSSFLMDTRRTKRLNILPSEEVAGTLKIKAKQPNAERTTLTKKVERKHHQVMAGISTASRRSGHGRGILMDPKQTRSDTELGEDTETEWIYTDKGKMLALKESSLVEQPARITRSIERAKKEITDREKEDEITSGRTKRGKVRIKEPLESNKNTGWLNSTKKTRNRGELVAVATAKELAKICGEKCRADASGGIHSSGSGQRLRINNSVLSTNAPVKDKSKATDDNMKNSMWTRFKRGKGQNNMTDVSSMERSIRTCAPFQHSQMDKRTRERKLANDSSSNRGSQK